MSRARLRSVGALLTLAAHAVLATSAIAQLPAPLSYRRVYVPEEALESQIRGLLPLKRDEFQRRLALIAAQSESAASRAAVASVSRCDRVKQKCATETQTHGELAV